VSQPPDAPPSAAWGAPPGSTPAAPALTRTSGLAVASLVTGLFFWCLLVPGIVAIVLGYLALEQIDRSGGATTGRGMAVAGIILGWVGIALLGIGVLAWFISVVTI
jgi:Domain of unknown function (DUF4190)